MYDDAFLSTAKVNTSVIVVFLLCLVTDDSRLTTHRFTPHSHLIIFCRLCFIFHARRQCIRRRWRARPKSKGSSVIGHRAFNSTFMKKAFHILDPSLSRQPFSFSAFSTPSSQCNQRSRFTTTINPSLPPSSTEDKNN